MEEDRWDRKLVQLRNATRYAIAGTVGIGLCVLFFDWKEGLATLCITALQFWVYAYYTQRIAGEDASMPGPVTVSEDSRLSSRIEWDKLAFVFVVLPAGSSLLVLGKHLIHVVR